MQVKVNDKATEIPDGLTIAELLIHQKVKMPDMVSVQLNGTILKREDFPATQVRENDSVDFLYFMGGGGRASAAAAETSGKEGVMAYAFWRDTAGRGGRNLMRRHVTSRSRAKTRWRIV